MQTLGLLGRLLVQLRWKHLHLSLIPPCWNSAQVREVTKLLDTGKRLGDVRCFQTKISGSLATQSDSAKWVKMAQSDLIAENFEEMQSEMQLMQDTYQKQAKDTSESGDGFDSAFREVPCVKGLAFAVNCLYTLAVCTCKCRMPESQMIFVYMLSFIVIMLELMFWVWGVPWTSHCVWKPVHIHRIQAHRRSIKVEE